MNIYSKYIIPLWYIYLFYFFSLAIRNIPPIGTVLIHANPVGTLTKGGGSAAGRLPIVRKIENEKLSLHSITNHFMFIFLQFDPSGHPPRRLHSYLSDFRTPPESWDIIGTQCFIRDFTILRVPFGTFLGLRVPRAHIILNLTKGGDPPPAAYPSSEKLENVK